MKEESMSGAQRSSEKGAKLGGATMVEALREALIEEMERDQSVVLIGEDIGRLGGVFRVTEGLLERFGRERVIDAPLAEGGIVGAAIGMAMYGLRPVVEIQFADFIYPAFDQLVNEAAKMRYRTGGRLTVPMVVRVPAGGGIKGGHYHSQSPEAYFTHTPGLKVYYPASPNDARAMLREAIRDPDPVIFFEPKRVYRAVREPHDDLEVAERARILRRGEDLSCISYGASIYECLEVAAAAERAGVDIELIDLRSLLPLDEETIDQSVRRTGRALIVHEAPLTAGFGAEILSGIVERNFEWLKARPARVAGIDAPFPYRLELDALPNAARILGAVEMMIGRPIISQSIEGGADRSSAEVER